MERLGGLELQVLFVERLLAWSGDIGALAFWTGPICSMRTVSFRLRKFVTGSRGVCTWFRGCGSACTGLGLGLGWPVWVDAASFDLAEHLRVVPLDAPG